ncbi:GHMP kinase [Streptomyces sp. NPDC002779]|uniref:GHMP family kinase ATP-binding protein n=1 Tax=Streptomyces sp. NPDC002779 TaxID=3364664 RepID=UPI00369BB89A
MFSHEGEEVRALVTLPFPDLVSVATAELLPLSDQITVTPLGRTKAATAARLTLEHLGLDIGCRVSLDNEIPHALGLGSSTADVVATIRAVADAAGHRLAATAVAWLATQAEVAADSVMYSGVVPLFAHREGRLLQVLGPELPPLLVLGCVLDSGGIDTLGLSPASYTDDEKAQLGVLLSAVRYAVRHGDPVILGRAATCSARINQRFAPQPLLPELSRIAEASGAVGVQVAHSGTVAGILFDGRSPDKARAAAEKARVALAAVGIEDTYQFTPHEVHRGGGGK